MSHPTESESNMVPNMCPDPAAAERARNFTPSGRPRGDWLTPARARRRLTREFIADGMPPISAAERAVAMVPADSNIPALNRWMRARTADARGAMVRTPDGREYRDAGRVR